jgi:beta-galactosidase
LDTLEKQDYRRGASWYRRQLVFSEGDLQQRLFLRFGAAGQEAEVFVNGHAACAHLGAYSAFTVELSKLVHVGTNQVDVRVNNGTNKFIVPVNDSLFNLYGGLYRRVQLLRAPPVCLSRTTLAGPGVRVWSEHVSAESARARAQVEVDFGGAAPGPFELRAELVNAAGTVVAHGSSTNARIKLSEVKRPALWTPETPALYTLTVRLLRQGREVDRAAVRHGFRWYEFTADRGFFLNGKPYKLHGLNRHQDVRGVGSAVSPEQHFQDLTLMKEVGANWLRLAHYQQDDYVLQLCDELGLLVWEEVPYVRVTTFDPEFERNLHATMREMIAQHFNHPSILVWGMGNEIYFKKGDDGRAREFNMLTRLNDLMHAEDPTRKTAIVSGDANTYSDLKVMTIPDVIGYNLYLGWYGGTMDKLTARLEELHRRDPSKPMVVTEFGAGCDPTVRTDQPKPFDQSQEYQVLFLQSYLDQMDALPWLCGYNWWNFADFGWAKSSNPPLLNNKGLVTFDRRKKDGFFYIKARWNGARD